MIKCEDNTQDYSMDSNSRSGDESDDNCKDTAHAEALKLINMPLECDNAQLEVSRFKGELQRISNIVEDTRTPQMTHYLKKLNTSLEVVNDAQQFYEIFSKILD